MMQFQEATALRIFTDETAYGEQQPLVEEIIRKARNAHLAGATVFRGPMGFGGSGVLHTDKILRLSFELPVIIEIVDSDVRIKAFLPELASYDNCMLTLRSVHAWRAGVQATHGCESHLH